MLSLHRYRQRAVARVLDETEDRFVVTLELPGIEPDAVDVSVEDSTLTVQGERSFYSDVDEQSFHRVERRYGRFQRSLSLPATADSGANKQITVKATA